MSRPLERLEEFAIDVILERRYGKRASLLRALLYVLSGVYHRIVRVRLWLYEKRYVRVHALGCLVVSVGNLTVGGTGKTPIVEQLAYALTRQGRKVAILSRGYKSAAQPWWRKWHRKLKGLPDPPRIVSDGRVLLLDSAQAGDEPYMLANHLKNVVVLVDKNRVKSGLFAMEKFGVDTLLLDDGFQYLPLKERIDVVLIDRETPFGNRYLLPRGTLREPPPHLKRANLIFITKCDGSDLTELKRELRQHNQHAEIIECRHAPKYVQAVFGDERHGLDFLKGLRVGAISGIARPESFEKGLRQLGAEILYTRRYADHHRYTEEEITHMIARSKARGARAVLTTEKDAVRFSTLTRLELPVLYLRVEIELVGTNTAAFEDYVKPWCPQPTAEEARAREQELLFA
jgi:tetraacyldisaccharide 4'-kinase